MPVAKLYVGLCGKTFAGKGIFAEEFSRAVTGCGLTLAYIRRPDIFSGLFRTVTDEPSPETQMNFQKLLQVIREGEACSQAVRARLVGTNANVALYDGVRWPSDETALWTLPNYLMVYISSPALDRYERSKKRERDAGERTFEQFREEDNAVSERFIIEIGARADVQIENPGITPESEFEYRRQMRDQSRLIVAPLLQTATPCS